MHTAPLATVQELRPRAKLLHEVEPERGRGDARARLLAVISDVESSAREALVLARRLPSGAVDDLDATLALTSSLRARLVRLG